MISSYYITDILLNSPSNTKNAFDLGDFSVCNYPHITRNTIFTIATMEWLTKGDTHTKQLIRLLYKYYKNYPETKPPKYGKGIANWLENGGKWYRTDYECTSIAWCGIIAYTISDMNSLKTIVKRATKATHNTEIAFIVNEMISVAMYLNKKFHSKQKTLTYLIKHYNYKPCNNLEQFIETYKFNTNATLNAFAGLHCFFNTESFEESVKAATKLDSQFGIIGSIAGMLSETFYNDIPQNMSHYLLCCLPKEFLEIIYKFENCKNNKIAI